MKLRRERKLQAKALFDFTPLVDVVLILLFFFMLSSTFTVTATIPIEAAGIEAAPFFEEKDISITLLPGEEGPDGGGKIFVNESDVASWDDVSATLRELHEKAPEARVLIRPDAAVPSARLVRVLGIANAIGIERYGIAATSGAEE